MNQTTLLYVDLWLHKWYAFAPSTNREATCISFVYHKKKIRFPINDALLMPLLSWAYNNSMRKGLPCSAGWAHTWVATQTCIVDVSSRHHINTVLPDFSSIVGIRVPSWGYSLLFFIEVHVSWICYNVYKMFSHLLFLDHFVYS